MTWLRAVRPCPASTMDACQGSRGGNHDGTDPASGVVSWYRTS